MVTGSETPFPGRPEPVESPPDRASLGSFGYSESNQFNPLGILKTLEQRCNHDVSKLLKRSNSHVLLAPSLREEYLLLVRKLPSRSVMDLLVNNFFTECNWHYSILDHSVFMNLLSAFYYALPDIISEQACIEQDVLNLPPLLFQVAALALLFYPADRSAALNEVYGGVSLQTVSTSYTDYGVKLSTLVADHRDIVISLQAALLRSDWLKLNTKVAESWSSLAQVVREAEQLGLHLDCGDDLRQRLMINIFLWDSGMAVVLGKPANMTTQVLEALRLLPNEVSEKPSTFDMRRLEFRLQINLPQIRELEAEGPYPKDYGRVQRLHQEFFDFIKEMPPIYRFRNPDTSFDMEFPWLIPQREYLASTTFLYIIALHRPYLFSIKESRTEIVKAGIEVLHAQQRNVDCLPKQQYKHFIFAFLSFDAAISMLAILVAYPAENSERHAEVFACLRETVERLQLIGSENTLACAGSAVVQKLLARAEEVSSQTLSTSSHNAGVNPTTSSSETVDSAGFFEPDLGRRKLSDTSYSTMATLNEQGPGSQYDGIICLSGPPPMIPDDLDWVDNIDFGYLIEPLNPTADLMYHEIAPMNDGSYMVEDGNSNKVGQEHDTAGRTGGVQEQFQGVFPDHTFWGFVNQGL